MKLLAVTAAFVLGVALGGGQALASAATALVSDDSVTVEAPAPTPEDPSTDPDTDPTGDPSDEAADDPTGEASDEASDGASDGASDQSTDDPAGESESEGGDPTATATPYGQLVSTWVHCVKAGGTACGDRPHPPGAASGGDPAHVPGQGHVTQAPDESTGASVESPEVKPTPKHDAKHAGKATGKHGAKHAGTHAGKGRTH